MSLMMLTLLGCPILRDADIDARTDADGDGHRAAQFGGDDCDDADPDAFPGGTEVWYDGRDEDCSGDTDLDQDADRFDAASEGGDDCDDTDPLWHPGATQEDCHDPNDYNCDGITEYADVDGDKVPACEDCDDTNASVTGGSDWYVDADHDGFGDAAVPTEACEAPDGLIADGTDCDDTNNAIYPGAAERCGGVDHDCDGEVNEDTSVDRTTWYADADEDGYGNPVGGVVSCIRPAGFGCDSSDCDDTDSAIHPDAIEWACNTTDDDCDGDVAGWDIAVPGDYDNVADAAHAAEPGQVICVGAGTWMEHFVVYTSGLTIEGRGADATFIDAEGHYTVIDVKAGERVAGFTLRGVTLQDAGGGYTGLGLVGVDDALLEDVVVTGDAGPISQGIAMSGTSAVLRHVDIVNMNQQTPYSGEGAGIWIASGSEATLTNVRILGNVMGVGESCRGAGMYVQVSDVTMNNVLIAGNRCEPTDAGINDGVGGILSTDSSTITMVNSAVLGNEVLSGDGSTGPANYDGGDSETLTVINSINAFGRGEPDATCGGWRIPTSADWSFAYSDTWANEGAGCSIADQAGIDGNLAKDPLFADTSPAAVTDWNLTLLGASPLIDAGDPSILDQDCTASDIGIFGGAHGKW